MNDPEPTLDEAPSPIGVVPALLFVALVGWIGAFLVYEAWATVRPPRPDWVQHAQSLALLFAGLVLFLVILPTGPEPPTRKQEPEAWLCKHCLKPFVPGAHFCPACSCPQTFYAVTPNFEQAYSVGWALGKAARHPSGVSHLLVIVLLGVPWVLWAMIDQLFLFWWDWNAFAAAPGSLVIPSRLLGSAWILLLAWIWLRLIVYVIRAWGRRRRGEEPLEPEIEYGHPPWWTFDAEWALPEVIEDDKPEDPSPATTPSAG